MSFDRSMVKTATNQNGDTKTARRQYSSTVVSKQWFIFRYLSSWLIV